MPDIDHDDGPQRDLGVPQPVHRVEADEAQQVVHDAQRRVQEHPPDQPDDDRVHQQRTEQDRVVDRLAVLDLVEHERDEEAEGEFEQHHRQDEERGERHGMAELGVRQRLHVVLEANEEIVAGADQGVVVEAG
ncbi:MAG TPA: hypothetical protein VFH77_05085, partial [Streptomyces sp.]|nr:hypothetical protein [Streptomyces sp.]